MRDRLIELLKRADDYSIWVGAIAYNDAIAANADYLIDNGVTVQEWISVKDRLPDLELVEAKTFDCDLYPCLVTIKNKRAEGGRYVGKAWYDGKGFMNADCVDITYEVTHWMPLPPAPKGE